MEAFEDEINSDGNRKSNFISQIIIRCRYQQLEAVLELIHESLRDAVNIGIANFEPVFEADNIRRRCQQLEVKTGTPTTHCVTQSLVDP